MATWGDQSSSASVPGAVGGEQHAVTLREVGTRGRGQWDRGRRSRPSSLKVAVGQAGPRTRSCCWAGPSGLQREPPAGQCRRSVSPLLSTLISFPRWVGGPGGRDAARRRPPSLAVPQAGASDGRGPPSGELRLPGWMKESGLRAGRSQALRLCASCPQRRASGACQAARREKTLERGALDRAGRPGLGGPSAQRGAGGISTRPLPSPEGPGVP